MIKVHGLSHAYQVGTSKVPVLHDVSLSIKSGEMVAIKGPSGSGKSTLLHIIGCLLEVQSGEVEIAGQSTKNLNSDARAHLRNATIGFIFQQFHLIPRTSILDNILLPAKYGPPEKQQVQRAKELADKLGLEPELLKKFPNQLSGGQQQRVAIARALMNQPNLILADEPTGNLDSARAKDTLKILRELNDEGRTVVIITHDPEVAAGCDRVIEVRDGKITSDQTIGGAKSSVIETSEATRIPRPSRVNMWSLLPLAFVNLRRNKLRSFLTMLGITIGIAAVIAMVTVGQFAKDSILSGYEELGVNRMVFYGYPNWRAKATDDIPVMFRSFDMEDDLEPLKRIFPEVEMLSPVIRQWRAELNFGGRQFEEGQPLGVTPEYFAITNRKILLGQGFSRHHVDRRMSVCVIGHAVAERLFRQVQPIGQVVNVKANDVTYGCRVIGVLKSQNSNSEWWVPDNQILLPYTYLEVIGNWWESRITNVVARVAPGTDIEKTGDKVKAFYGRKYGPSGNFRVSRDDILIAQMRKGLTVFAILLTSIAFISLLVGGIGIMNMMLVSVAERYREIGVRKAFGATDGAVRKQFLLESVMLCAIAGVAGLAIGFGAYQGIIYGGSQVSDHISFEWVVDPVAVTVASISILGVGLLSGLVPALKAQRLQVIEALRSE